MEVLAKNVEIIRASAEKVVLIMRVEIIRTILGKAPNVLPSQESIRQRIKEAGFDVKGKKLDDIANVLWIDDALGAHMKKLEETGKLDNTIIFFFNDHGQHAKGSVYEGGVSDPSIIWKNIFSRDSKTSCSRNSAS